MARLECFFQPGQGKIAPPRTIVAFCPDDALPGVRRSLERLAETRCWAMTTRTVTDDEMGHPAGAPLLPTGTVVSRAEYEDLARTLGGGL